MQNKPFQDVISDLMILSAVYGSIYCEMAHGEWQFDGEYTVIRSIYKKNRVLNKLRPLANMIVIWKGSQYETLVSDCEYAEMKYNRWGKK